jgi:polysaccharide chain length determinant protein (PEP-CTERM system associated)
MDFFRAVWRRRRWLAVVSFALPLSVAVSVVASLPNLFRCTALLIVEHEQPRGIPVGQTALSDIETRLQTLNQENLSRTVLREFIVRFDLYPDFRRKASLEEAVDRLRRDIQVEIKQRIWERDTVAFTLSYRGRNPQTVAQVTNALASLYVEQSVRQRERQTRAMQLLKSQLEEMKGRLAAEEERVTNFKTQHLRELPGQLNVNLQMMERLNNQLASNRERQMRARVRLQTLADQLAVAKASASTRPADGAGSVPGGPSLGRLAQLNEELRQLRTQVTDQHPDVARLKAEIASLTELTKAAPVSIPKPQVSSLSPQRDPPIDRAARLRSVEDDSWRSRSELRALEEEEQALTYDIAQCEAKIYNAPKREQELEQLLPAYERTRALYNSLLARLEEAQLQENLERQHANDPFRIVDPAVASNQPAAPNRLRLLVTGLILSLGLAMAAVLLAERLDSSFHTLEEIRSLAQVPVLVSVPNIVTPKDAASGRRRACVAVALVVFALASSIGGTYVIAHQNEQLVWKLAGQGAATLN